MGLDLALLMEFVTLARHLNFSKAAQELNLTQPTLSRHIVQLEEEVDVQLFRRDRQSVSLTEAGALFLPEATAVMARYDAALRRLREYRDGMAGSLTIGYRWIFSGGPWPHVLHVFREQYPQIAVRLVSYQDSEPLQDAVRDGVLDVAVTLRTDDALPAQFQGVLLRSVPLVAAMRSGHPLTAQGAVTPAQLASERLLVPQTRSSMGFPALMSSFFRSYGLTPAVCYSGERLEEALLRVQMDNVISLVPQCYFPDTPVPGIHSAQVAGTTGIFRLLALAAAGSPNPAVPLFLRTCRAELKRQRLDDVLE